MAAQDRFQLAQVNVAHARAALDSPEMAEFAALLEGVNRLADEAPGFVWRLKGGGFDNAIEIRAYDDPRIIFNLSVWDDVEALKAYTYRSDHGAAFRRRKDWFLPGTQATYALWWVPAGEVPTVEEAKARLEHLRAHGETQRAFSFRRPFPAPSSVPQQ